MSKKAFEKFIDKPIGGAKKKEIIRQEKKKEKRERRAAIEESKRKRWERENGHYESNNLNQAIRGAKEEREKAKSEINKYPKKAQNRPSFNDNKSAKRSLPADLRQHEKAVFKTESRQTKSKTGNDNFIGKKKISLHELRQQEKPKEKSSSRNLKTEISKAIIPKGSSQFSNSNVQPDIDILMPLNKYIAHCGVCGRREAAELIKRGKVKINNEIIYEPGFKITGLEKILVNDKAIHLQKNLVYILLNKPKDFITTVSDPEGRKTVLDLIKGANAERIYPIGRLDRNTTGVLLLTNDGELAQKLTHPSFEVKKIYEVTLDKPLTKAHFDAILNGITLEDGFIAPDLLAYADSKDKKIIGIEIHSGRNRIVRRIFEHLGYDVKNLDRVMFAGLTKKNVDRSKWRYLSEKEVRLLKYLNQGLVKK